MEQANQHLGTARIGKLMGQYAILSMNSMQSCTMKDVSEGVTYLSIMEKNLEVLRTALNREG